MVDGRVTHADLVQVRREIAEQRGHAFQLRYALGNEDPGLAALELQRMHAACTSIPDIEARLVKLETMVASLVAWAKTVTPPFTPPQ